TSSAPAPTCPNCGARPTRPPILSLMTASPWSRPDASSCCAANAETDGPSVRPGEGREMPIITPAGQIEVEPESVHLQFLGLGQSGAPAGVGALVHEDAEDPIAVGHDLARAQHERKFAPVEAVSAEIPVIDAEDQDGVAIIVGHGPLRVRIDAGADVVAIAAFHVLAADRPFCVCHGLLPDPDIRGAAELNAEPVAAQRPLPGSVV